MIRLIMLTDFTETFPHRLLRGILQYARDKHQQWMVCRMPLSFKDEHGMEGVVAWAREWKADAIVGKFEQTDDVTICSRQGIIAIAQDHKALFSEIPNVTSDYRSTGRLAAEYFLNRGFRSFAFCGYTDTVWSVERCEGFKSRIKEVDQSYPVSIFNDAITDQPWQNNDLKLISWLQSLPPRTAVFCCDDRQGSMVLAACSEAGIDIPQDKAVLGVDNDELRDELSKPTLSSVNLDIEQGGYQLGQMIEEIKFHHRLPQANVVISNLGIITRDSTNTFATDDPYVQKAIDAIHVHIDYPVSVNDLLRNLPLSRRLLEIRFKEATGKTLHEYIVDCRLDRFASLLLQTKKSIKEIAIELQFNNYGNLLRIFRDHKGCTPTEYREKNCNLI